MQLVPHLTQLVPLHIGAEDAHSFNYQGMFLNVLDDLGYLKVCSRMSPEDTPAECKVGG
jgi:hypothetical protein